MMKLLRSKGAKNDELKPEWGPPESWDQRVGTRELGLESWDQRVGTRSRDQRVWTRRNGTGELGPENLDQRVWTGSASGVRQRWDQRVGTKQVI